MRNVVVVAENEEACKLLDCLLAYKKVIGATRSSGNAADENFATGLLPTLEAGPRPRKID